ncbi:hypothetical protein CQW23_03956 [Capsicum baccatum]|uniref:WRC domain-containing protein n=1 Tax=Capsicum baccatum TaxID=33114 RepID=A0A2G2XDB8_CAPBA|nr:hypothetical protein CQW23_03956 [Capsicum baccatum]
MRQDETQFQLSKDTTLDRRSVQEQEDSEQLQQHDISNTQPRDEDGDVDASLLSATKLQDSAGNRHSGDSGGGCRKLPAEVLSLERIGGKVEVEKVGARRSWPLLQFLVHGFSSYVYNLQLNQSPWDVITFHDDNIIDQQPLLVAPPPPASSSYQLDGYDCCVVNETFSDSQQSITSMKLDDNGETKKMNFLDNNIADVPADCSDFEKDEEMVDVDNNVPTMCVKNDGKGWQCSREAKRGYNLCEHHFAQGKKHCSSNNSAQYSTTTAANSDTEIKHTVAMVAEPTPSSRARPHRPKKSSSSEYYYYSGFGPLWGKKRGPSTGKKNNNTAPPVAGAAAIYSSHDSTTQGGQSSSPQMDNEGVEHVEDDGDDGEEVENCKLIKRARKPIKARSLKSLM